MKQCFKCLAHKPLVDFYKHPMMLDGHLNKCKECAKRDVAENIKIRRTDKDWVANERARCREKSKRQRAIRPTKQSSKKSKEDWCIRNAHKRSAQIIAYRAKKSGKILAKSACEDCDKPSGKLQMHHEDYSKPLDVVFLCTECHGKRHWKDRVK